MPYKNTPSRKHRYNLSQARQPGTGCPLWTAEELAREIGVRYARLVALLRLSPVKPIVQTAGKRPVFRYSRDEVLRWWSESGQTI